MGQNFAAVESDPKKRVMREFVDQIPGNFLRDEMVHSAQAHDLRQLRRIAERV